MTTHPDLAKQIEDLVRQHVDVLRASAAAAVARAFAAAPVSARANTSSRPTRAVKARKKPAPRRSSEELVALGERFHAVLCERPGETMTTLAPHVGVAPRVLQVAVARLRREGRVRVIGKKQHTRYYPMAVPTTTAPPVAVAA